VPSTSHSTHAFARAMAGLLLSLAALAPATARAASPAAMLRVPAGDYRPFYKGRSGARRRIPVASFQLDREPVSERDFLAFVTAHPDWRRSQVKRLFAEPSYLADWTTDLAPPRVTGAPVTRVSWFAARAYCECEGERLPTQAEWEWAAERRLVMGDVWEWTSDFNTLLLADPSPVGESSSSLFCGDGFRATDAKDYGGFLRFSFRSSLKASYALKNLGFRCAKDLP